MAYIRRYLAGQQATTVVIAEGAITSDKISDKAIITRTIDDEAVGSKQIRDEAILSEDIKDGAVGTTKLADNSVTTPKIVDKAVTVAKLSTALQGSARPFVPGIATTEIADLVVTASKIANEAIETPKVKDANITEGKLAALSVTKAKLAAGSVDTDKIEAAAVDVTKLKNLSVNEGKIIDGSVSENKIGALAVSTGKIQDRNVTGGKIALLGVIAENLGPDAVTEPKLDPAALGKRHIASKRVRLADVHEEFLNGSLSNGWLVSMAAGGGVSSAGILGLAMVTGALNNDDVTLSSDDICRILESLPWFETLVKHAQLTQRTTRAGVKDGAGNWVGFQCIAGGGANWFARCDYADGATLVDTGIESGTLVDQLLSFEVVSPTLVRFYIDGSPVAEIPSTIPAITAVKPEIYFQTNAAGGKSLRVRYLSLLGERP